MYSLHWCSGKSNQVDSQKGLETVNWPYAKRFIEFYQYHCVVLRWNLSKCILNERTLMLLINSNVVNQKTISTLTQNHTIVVLLIYLVV